MSFQSHSGEVDAIIATASSNVPPADRAKFSAFVARLYADVATTDIMEEGASQHAARCLGFWQWGQALATGASHVRLYNPPSTGGHWRADSTAIEIITPDMPFLVDSIAAALSRAGAEVRLLLHPVYSVGRGPTGALQSLSADKVPNVPRESWMHISIRRLPEAALLPLKEQLEKVLADVAVAVADWRPMGAAMQQIIATLPESDHAEERAFLEWAHDNHFVFLGYRHYRLSADGARLDVQQDTALGLLRQPDFVVFKGIRQFGELPLAVQAYLRDPTVLIVNKARSRSTIHRDAPFDIIGVKSFDAAGQFSGLKVFIGLYTSIAYARTAEDVPWLRRKVQRVVERSGLEPKSHSGKALVHILNTYPRDDLFLMDEETLLQITRGILLLAERQRTAAFMWLEPFGRFWSCLIYTPRDQFDSALRHRFIALLEQGLMARSSGFTTWIGDSPLVRLQVTLDRPEGGAARKPDLLALEKRLIEAARGWDEKLEDALVAAHGPEAGLSLFDRFKGAFPAIYRESVTPQLAITDLPLALQALADGRLQLALHAVPGQPERLDLRLYHRGSPVVLSDILPRLENLGLRVLSEVPYALTPSAGDMVWVQAIATESRNGRAIELARISAPFIEAIQMLEAGAIEDDGLNALVLRTGLAAREVAVLRAYAHYLQQTGFAATPTFIRKTLVAHSAMALSFFRYFEAAFSPDIAADNRAEKTKDIEAGILTALDAVTNLAEDQVLRRMLNLLTSTLRTNYHQPDRGYISFKLDSQQVDGLPLPRPLVEIWVYSPRVEGVHLRGGRVARGGIRWSDRRDDFRTEVLGLMKAQMVKNTVIVPVGSKGGFVCKQLPSDRAAEGKEVIACYQTFIRGLLDLTDNRLGASVVVPQRVVCRDEADTYLVVAADKGTAKFSDIANALSIEYGFWLGDAFASGGSVGYDHKHMGITARGAWEAVKRHFREMGRDIQTMPFTCVGVGDMAGDVFGNGMLRSPQTLLVGAFNHKHIFIDPSPKAAESFAERQRLFNLSGSQWSDYNPALISPGGGVFERSAKSVPLSPQMQKLLGVTADKLAPHELVQALLKAEVDLLYLGGIGTYVKESGETHAEVSDRANDGLRVNGADLRAKVVGEGANLGFTARARIEYAQKGGRINSDAIDNSAGVDTSDHEVNIKIALQPEVAKGSLALPARNQLLAEMTEDVASLVLQDNYLQTQIISLEVMQASTLQAAHQRLMQTLEQAGRLNRAVEYLPSDAQLASRKGLTRPEIAILIAYSKMALYDELLRSDLPDDAALQPVLMDYFPKALQARLPDALKGHRLRREIIATVVVNDVVNRLGSTFAMAGQAMPPLELVRGYLALRQVGQLPALFAAIEALDNKVPGTVQLQLLQAVQQIVGGAVLANAPGRAAALAGMAERLQQPAEAAGVLATLQKMVSA